MVLLYPAYHALEFPLEFLYRAGRHAEIDQVCQTLQRIAGTTRQVPTKLPSVGCREAIQHWETITGIVRTPVTIRAENRP